VLPYTVGGLILPPKGGIAYGLLNGIDYYINTVKRTSRQKEITARRPN